MGPATNGTPTWAGGYPSATEAVGFRVAEYDRRIGVYPSLGYDIHVLSKVSVAERADFGLSPPMTPGPVQHGWGRIGPVFLFGKRRQCFALEPAADVASSRRNSAS